MDTLGSRDVGAKGGREGGRGRLEGIEAEVGIV
jgi:hypothetical protein